MIEPGWVLPLAGKREIDAYAPYAYSEFASCEPWLLLAPGGWEQPIVFEFGTGLGADGLERVILRMRFWKLDRTTVE